MILEVAGIDTFYGETQALFGVSLSVAPGEVLALLGPNGAGKTTTLRSVLGLTRPRRGAIRFDGRDVAHTATHEIARAGVAWVPDDRRLCPTLTVARNLAIAQKRTRFRPWSVKETAEIFSPLEYLLERECENLSGGEMQMVAIAARWWAGRAWCCSTSRARGWHRRSSATCWQRCAGSRARVSPR